MPLLDATNYSFSLYAVPTLATGMAVLVLGLLNFIRERISQVSVLFLLITLSAALWLFGISLAYCAGDEAAALWWAKAAKLGVVFIPSSIYHFTVVILRIWQKHKRTVWLGWAGSAIFFASIVATPYFIDGVHRYWWGYYPDYRWLSIPFLLFFFGMYGASLRHYWTEYAGARGAHKARIRSLMIAFAVGAIGSFDYLAAYGVPLYPFGYLAVLGFVAITARTIRRYRLVNVTAAFAANEIIDAMADALVVFDTDRTVRVVNQGACRLFGKPESELVGRPVTAMDGELFTAEWLDRLMRAGSIRDDEITLVPGQGEAVTLSVTASVMRDPSHEPVAVVCIMRDISERKQAEEQIQRGLQRLLVLRDINLAIASTADLADVLDLVLEKIDFLLPYEAATTVKLVNRETGTLVLAASRHLGQTEWTGDRWWSGRDLAQIVFESKAPLLVSNLQTNPAIENPEFYRRNGLISYLGVPLIAKNEVLGVLSFYTKNEHELANEEIDLLRTLAEQAAIAIYNSQLLDGVMGPARQSMQAGREGIPLLHVLGHAGFS